MTTFSGAQLASALHSQGVDFVLSSEDAASSLKDDPARLIAALAESDEARLRLSLIPLFLQHPEFAEYLDEAFETVSASARLTLECFYTAALWLQKKYSGRLVEVIGEKPKLTDLFSKQLGLPHEGDADTNLDLLAQQHQTRSGKYINWRGTYEHGALRFITHMERLKQWQH